MRGVDCEIEEAEFHIHGLATLISVLTQMPRMDPEIVRTLSYSLQLAHDRKEVLEMMKKLLR